MGDNSVGEFNSVAVTNNHQQAIPIENDPHWRNTKSTIVSKGISAGKSENSYRGLVKVMPKATNSRNFSQCDSLLLNDTVERTLSRTSKLEINRRLLNTRQQHRKLVKTRFSIVTNVESTQKLQLE